MVVWLSAFKNKKLNGCGTFTLVGDMPSAIVRVDLSGMDSLEASLDQFANCKAITSFNVNGCEKLTGTYPSWKIPDMGHYLKILSLDRCSRLINFNNVDFRLLAR